MLRFLVRQWFLVALVVFLVVGMLAAPVLEPVTEMELLRNVIVAVVLFLMSLPLETRVMWNTVRRPLPALLATGINFGLVPLAGWGLMHFLPGDLAVGLMVTAATPCTLAGATVWTRRAHGNEAVAMMVTVITNTTCFLVMPAWLLWLAPPTRGSMGIDVATARSMIFDLVVLVVLPIVAGQVVRQWRPVAAWAGRHKVLIGEAVMPGILVMVLNGAIKSGLELRHLESGGPGPADFALMLVLVLGLHLAAVATGHGLALGAGMNRPDRIAIGFAGSQKTLMVGLHIAMTYYSGLAVLPMVAYHTGQLILDTIIGDWLVRREGKLPNQEIDKASPLDSE